MTTNILLHLYQINTSSILFLLFWFVCWRTGIYLLWFTWRRSFPTFTRRCNGLWFLCFVTSWHIWSQHKMFVEILGVRVVLNSIFFHFSSCQDLKDCGHQTHFITNKDDNAKHEAPWCKRSSTLDLRLITGMKWIEAMGRKSVIIHWILYFYNEYFERTWWIRLFEG